MYIYKVIHYFVEDGQNLIFEVRLQGVKLL